MVSFLLMLQEHYHSGQQSISKRSGHRYGHPYKREHHSSTSSKPKFSEKYSGSQDGKHFSDCREKTLFYSPLRFILIGDMTWDGVVVNCMPFTSLVQVQVTTCAWIIYEKSLFYVLLSPLIATRVLRFSTFSSLIKNQHESVVEVLYVVVGWSYSRVVTSV